VRRNYQNLTAVAQQVNTYASIPNLLNWETAHEPDGNADPHNATLETYDFIYAMDGYHPISIVLNCQDYNFSPYVTGADIVLHVRHSEHNIYITCSSNCWGRMLILLVSMLHGLWYGIHRAPRILVAAAVTTAKAPCTMSRRVSKLSKIGLTSWASTAPNLCGLRPNHSAVASMLR